MSKVVLLWFFLVKMLCIHAAAQIVAGYVANSTGNTLVEFNVPFNTVVSSIPTSSSSTAAPSSIAISSDGLKVYVANKSSNTIGVIDPSTYSFSTISDSSFDSPVRIFINPSGTQAYVINNGNSTVSVLDLTSNTVIQTIAVGSNLKGGVFRPDGVYAYVTSAGDDSVYVIQTSVGSTASVFATIAIGSGITPNQIAMNQVAISGVYYAYVACSNSTSIRIINTSLNTVSSTVLVGSAARSEAVTPDGTNVYITRGGGIVRRMNTSTFVLTSVTDSASTFNSPNGIAITPDGTTAYVVNTGNNTLSIIDISTNAVTGTISTNTGTALGALTVGSVAPLTASLVTGSINLSGAYTTGVTASVTNTTPATVYGTLAAYQLNPSFLPPTPGWVSNQTAIGTPSSKTIASGTTNSSFSIDTSTGFSGSVQFDLLQASNQVSLSTITDPNAAQSTLNIYSAYIISY